jgi:hypothetical protein
MIKLQAPDIALQYVDLQLKLGEALRAGLQVGSQIQPTLMCVDIGDVRDPVLVWLIMLELTLQLIGGHLRRLAHLVHVPHVPPDQFDL